jgi:hypothetical protein
MGRIFEHHISGYFNSHRNSFDYRITKDSYYHLKSLGIENIFKQEIITFNRIWTAFDEEDMGVGLVRPSDLSSLTLYKKPR